MLKIRSRRPGHAATAIALCVAMLAGTWFVRAEEKLEVAASDAPTTAPATQPAKQLTAETQALVDEIGKAYDALGAFDMAGTMSADFDVAGQKQKQEEKFTASFQAPRKFRHEMNDDVLIGSTGDKFYAYQKKQNVFVTNDLPEGDTLGKDGPKLTKVIQMQNPSLTLAVATNAASELTSDAASVEKVDDTTIDGTAYDTLLLTGAGSEAIKLLFDPTTHLLRQVSIDMREMITKRGAPDVKTATVLIDYTSTTPNIEVKEGQFDWTAPEGAKDASAMAQGGGAGADGEESNPADALVGKPAPEFKLTSLAGEEVAMADLKGKAVVLDFWATWCGPCVQALPHLDKIYQENKEAGLQVFAVNLRETNAKVQKFVDDKKMSIPVLMDTKGSVAEQYMVQGIPQTVVIGKDGVVRKVFVGFGPGGDEALKKEIAQAMKDGD